MSLICCEGNKEIPECLHWAICNRNMQTECKVRQKCESMSQETWIKEYNQLDKILNDIEEME